MTSSFGLARNGLGRLLCAWVLLCPLVSFAQSSPSVPPTLPKELNQSEQGSGGIETEEEEDTGVLTIEEIVNSLVVSASNREESSLKAPAWVITITADDIKDRGYSELTDFLDDLPSMDIIRPYGDTYFKNYWRGYRNTIGAPYLLMLDGIIFNQLWLNEATIMAAMPLSNVERVEVLYGPASAVYGPNAAMGVINVITKNDHKTNTAKFKSYVGVRTPQKSIGELDHMSKIADMSVFYKTSKFRASVSARMDYGVLDPNLSDQFEWLNNKYYSDRQLWGDFVDYPSVAGEFKPPIEKQAVDARLYFKNTEFAAQYFSLLTGTGSVYPADKIQAKTLYTLVEKSFYIRHVRNLGESLLSTTLLRYRQSNVDSPTTDLERWPVDNSVSFQYWGSWNSSYTLSQDFSLLAGENLLLKDDELLINSGLRYERRDLERAYRRSGNDVWWDPSVKFMNAEDPSAPSFSFPDPLIPEPFLNNRNKMDVIGFYLLSRYNFLPNHSVDLGGRLDYNEFLDARETTFRGGYVGRFFDQLVIKALYGQAVQEPTWRELFGAWSGVGSNPGLKSERSQTGELSINYTIDWFFAQANAYVIHYTDAIISTTASGQNIGTRIVSGADFGIQALPPVPGLSLLKIWAYYSPYFYAKETDPADSTQLTNIGDLAAHKVILGLTGKLNRRFGASLLGRCASARIPVKTNPASFDITCSADAHVFLNNLFIDGLSLTLRATNLLDTKNFHPGLGDADSGETPGRWEGSTWVGSGKITADGNATGYSNSKLPQPGRAFTLSLRFDL